MTNSPIARVPLPWNTPLATMATAITIQYRHLILATEMVRRILASYVALLWLYTAGWLGVAR